MGSDAITMNSFHAGISFASFVLWRSFGFAGVRRGAKRGRFAYLSKGDLLPDTGLGCWLRRTPRLDNASASHSLAFLYLNKALIP
jgi:hypothetical protein